MRYRSLTLIFISMFVTGSFLAVSLASAGTSSYALFRTSLPVDTPLNTKSYTYTALGDSIAVGLYGNPGYVEQYKDAIEQRTQTNVLLYNRASNGATTESLLKDLQSDTSLQQQIQQSDIVTFNIGGNDLLATRDLYKQQHCGGINNQTCLQESLRSFQANWEAILQQIDALTTNRHVLIRTFDLYYPYVQEDSQTTSFPTQQGTDLAVFLPYFNSINSYIHSSVANHPRIQVANVKQVFNGAEFPVDPSQKGYLSSDHLHPNSEGHKLITAQLLQTGFNGLPVAVVTPNVYTIPTPVPTISQKNTNVIPVSSIYSQTYNSPYQQNIPSLYYSEPQSLSHPSLPRVPSYLQPGISTDGSSLTLQQLPPLYYSEPSRPLYIGVPFYQQPSLYYNRSFAPLLQRRSVIYNSNQAHVYPIQSGIPYYLQNDLYIAP